MEGRDFRRCARVRVLCRRLFLSLFVRFVERCREAILVVVKPRIVGRRVSRVVVLTGSRPITYVTWRPDRRKLTVKINVNVVFMTLNVRKGNPLRPRISHRHLH